MTTGLTTIATGLGGVLQRALFGWTEGTPGPGERGEVVRHGGLLDSIQNLLRSIADKLTLWLATPETKAMFGNVGKGITDALMSFTQDAGYLATVALAIDDALVQIIGQIDWNRIYEAIVPGWMRVLQQLPFYHFLLAGKAVSAIAGATPSSPMGGYITPGISTGGFSAYPVAPPIVPETRASGGWAVVGKSYRVNERGGEMFVPRSTGYVTPAHSLQQSFAYNMNVTDTLAAAMMMDMMRRQQRARLNAAMG